MMNEEIKTTESTVETEQEKKFTQADVDRIVGERLKRVRADQQTAALEAQESQVKQLAQRENELSSRENRLTCREYLLDKAYPVELLDVIDTSDPKVFQEKADTAFHIMQAQTMRAPAPLASVEPPDGYWKDSLDSAFAPGAKHTPKAWPPQFNE